MVRPALTIGNDAVAFALPERIDREDGRIVLGASKADFNDLFRFHHRMARHFGLGDVLHLQYLEDWRDGDFVGIDCDYAGHCLLLPRENERGHETPARLIRASLCAPSSRSRQPLTR